MKYKFFFSIMLITNLIVGQEYHWPTSTGKQLTSNFGEFRSNHFHMGLDIRTNSSIDHPLYAVSDGYIYRIVTNFGGYGKAIYLKTTDRKIAVYGHLNRYTDIIEKRIFKLQDEKQSYFINKYFSDDEFPIKRGDIIGYSGNSGGSSGPHLHFEVRNENDQPLNPKTNGFGVKDFVHPQFRELSIIPLESNTKIDNSSLPKIYDLLQIAPNQYSIKDTIEIDGKFGVSTLVVDKIQNIRHTYQIHKINMYVDSVNVFKINYNLLDFSEGKFASTVYGQPINNANRDDCQKLYLLEDYPKLSIHDGINGILDLSNGIHKIDIIAEDAAKNISTLSFCVKKIPKVKRHAFSHIPKYVDYPIYQHNSSIFQPKLVQLEKGIIFELQTDDPIHQLLAFIEYSNTIKTFRLSKIKEDKFISDLLDISLFDNIESCGFLFYSDSVSKYNFDFLPKLIKPNIVETIVSTDSLFMIKSENSFFDTTLLWSVKHSKPLNTKSYNRKSNIYEIFPGGIPLKNKLSIKFALGTNEIISQCAIFSYNDDKSKWNYINSTINDSTKTVSTKLNKPAIVAVLEDSQPPWFLYTYPSKNDTIAQSELKTITVSVDDDLSGINSSEDNLQVHLDGKRLWVAYQPVDREISYRLPKYLSIGEHKLIIKIADRCGNSSSKSIKFFIE